MFRDKPRHWMHNNNIAQHTKDVHITLQRITSEYTAKSPVFMLMQFKFGLA
jgi:hypothetical protein